MVDYAVKTDKRTSIEGQNTGKLKDRQARTRIVAWQTKYGVTTMTDVTGLHPDGVGAGRLAEQAE